MPPRARASARHARVKRDVHVAFPGAKTPLGFGTLSRKGLVFKLRHLLVDPFHALDWRVCKRSLTGSSGSSVPRMSPTHKQRAAQGDTVVAEGLLQQQTLSAVLFAMFLLSCTTLFRDDVTLPVVPVAVSFVCYMLSRTVEHSQAKVLGYFMLIALAQALPELLAGQSFYPLLDLSSVLLLWWPLVAAGVLLLKAQYVMTLLVFLWFMLLVFNLEGTCSTSTGLIMATRQLCLVLLLVPVLLAHSMATKITKHFSEQTHKNQQRFISNMSHEMRTPMASLSHVLELIADSAKSPSVIHYAKMGQSSSEQLQLLTNDVLDFSRLQVGAFEVKPDDFDVEVLLIEAVETVMFQVGTGSKAEFTYFIDPQCPPRLLGDVVRVRQVLLNILKNAKKFTSKGFVHVDVSVSKRRSRKFELCFEVRDTGRGIASNNLHLIFRRFASLDTSHTREHQHGAGLGLAISRRLIRRMGGRVGVKSGLRIGSKFWFTITFGSPSAGRGSLPGRGSSAPLSSTASPLSPDQPERTKSPEELRRDEYNSLLPSYAFVTDDDAFGVPDDAEANDLSEKFGFTPKIQTNLDIQELQPRCIPSHYRGEAKTQIYLVAHASRSVVKLISRSILLRASSTPVTTLRGLLKLPRLTRYEIMLIDDTAVSAKQLHHNWAHLADMARFIIYLTKEPALLEKWLRSAQQITSKLLVLNKPYRIHKLRAMFEAFEAQPGMDLAGLEQVLRWDPRDEVQEDEPSMSHTPRATSPSIPNQVLPDPDDYGQAARDRRDERMRRALQEDAEEEEEEDDDHEEAKQPDVEDVAPTAPPRVLEVEPPVIEEEEPPPVQKALAPPALPTKAPRRPRFLMHVLVVDDDDFVRMLLPDVVRDLDHKASCASDGIDGIESFVRNMVEDLPADDPAEASLAVVDMIFMDRSMPRCDGNEATRMIRLWEEEVVRRQPPAWHARFSLQDLRVVIIETSALDSQKSAKAPGVDFNLPKPIKKSGIKMLSTQFRARIERRRVAIHTLDYVRSPAIAPPEAIMPRPDSPRSDGESHKDGSFLPPDDY